MRTISTLITLVAILHTVYGQSTGLLETGKSGKCLTVTSLSNGAQVKTTTCNTFSTSQTWQFRPSVSKTNTLLRTSDDYCLDLPDGKVVNGAKLQIWKCNSANLNQFWNRINNNIRFAKTDHCLDVADGVSRDFVDGLSLQIWKCDYNNPAQRFSGPGPVAFVTTTSSAKSSSSTKASSKTSKASSTTTKASSTTSSTTSKSSSTTSSSTTSKSSSTTSKVTSTTPVSTTSSSSTTSRASSTSSSSSSTTARSTPPLLSSTTTLTATTRPTSITSSSSTTSLRSTTLSTLTRATSTDFTTVTSRGPTETTLTTRTTSASLPTGTVAKPALTSIFNPQAKRMLAWAYDNRVAGKISSGPLISTYHHWQDLPVPQMDSKVKYIATYWGSTKKDEWEKVKLALGDEVPHAVAGFNEPDIATQANMTASDAAYSFYHDIDQVYGRRGSLMIAPAVAWDVDNWLVPFMKSCKQLGCDIDAVGFHIYLDLNDDVDKAVAEVKRRIENVYAKTGKPIVLSEFGLTQQGGGTEEQMVEFLQKAGKYLDNNQNVLAWALSAVFAYGNGWDNYLNSQMAFYNSDGSLRDLAYKFMYDSW